MLSTGAFAVFLGDGPLSAQLFPLLWLAAYAVAVLGLVDQSLRLREPQQLPWALSSFVALALASTWWSVSPNVSLRRGIALGGTVAVGLFIARRLDAVSVFTVVRRAMVLVAVASLLLYALGDPRALDEVHQTLRGVVVTKNTLGRIMAIGLIAAAAEALLDRRQWRRCVLSAIPLALALTLSGSAGGAVLAVAGLAVIAAAALWRFDGGRSALPAAVAGVTGSLLLNPYVLSTERLLALTGRDPSLTGRTDIWAESLKAARDNPVLGEGFGAFWAVGSSEGSDGARRISARLAEPVANAHNGLLDLLLTTGLVGVALAVIVLGQLLLLGIRDGSTGRSGTAALRLVVLFLLLVSTAAETGLLQENALLTLLLAVAVGTGRGAAKGSPMPVFPPDSARRPAGSAVVQPALPRS